MKNVWTIIGIVLIVVLVLVLVGSIGMMGLGGLGARGMMLNRFGGYGMMAGFSPLHWILSLVFWALVIGGIVALVVWLARNGNRIATASSTPSVPAIESPLDILKARDAKGEITKEQYESMKQDLL